MTQIVAGARVTLLGPQRRPSLDKVVDALALRGPYATITAGWQEREGDDAELDRHLRGESRNLQLWQRMQQVWEHDGELAEAHRVRRERITALQRLYFIGVDHAMQAVAQMRDSARGGANARITDLAVADAERVLEDLDRRHLERVHEIHADFYAQWRPHERDGVADHRAQLAEILDGCGAVVLAGGHIAELLDALHLFNIAPAGLARLPIIAWSAGAMALTERVVLFNDNAARGPTWAEVFDGGLAVVPRMVLLPAAHARLHMDDRQRMATFARRFAPSRCVLLDPGTRVQIGDDGRLPDDTPVIGPDGAATTAGEWTDA